MKRTPVLLRGAESGMFRTVNAPLCARWATYKNLFGYIVGYTISK